MCHAGCALSARMASLLNHSRARVIDVQILGCWVAR